MKKLWVVFLLATSVTALAQQATDVVTLKSGAVYKGVISEYIPGGLVTMKLADGRVMSFEATEVRSVNEGGNRMLEVKKKGFFNMSTLGFQVGRSNGEGALSFAFNTVCGYKLGRSAFGAGTGLEALEEGLFVPTYAEYTYNFTNKGLSPFVSLQGGYAFNPSYQKRDHNPLYYWYYYEPFEYKEGSIVGLQFGIRNYFNSDFGFVFAVGYRYYNLKSDPYDQYLTQETSYPVTYRAVLHRFNFKLGILLN